MEDLIAISEMAKLNGITRQTLLHYDDIDLFKPVKVDDKGYRYYSRRQIPFLREICFLKSVGVSLKDVLLHFQDRSADKEAELLKQQKLKIVQEMARLSKYMEAISQRIKFLEQSMVATNMQIKEPFISSCAPKRLLFQEYIKPINRENLHTTLMQLWREVFKKEMVPCSSFGSMFRREDVLRHEPLKRAGSCVFLPVWNEDYPESIVLPASECACMYKYGMPYDTESLDFLMEWIDINGYELCGDIVDICLLDTTFYKEQKKLDYCLLQAPIRPKGL